MYSLLHPVFDFLYTAVAVQAKTVALVYNKLWGKLGIPWYDHRFDWLSGTANLVWVERGVLPLHYLTPESTVLDLACGDGIYSGLFYGHRALSVDALDADGTAISHAISKYPSANVTYCRQDILAEKFPGKNYDCILLFATLHYFSPEDRSKLLSKIARAMKHGAKSFFMGSVPVYSVATGHGNPRTLHEYTSVSNLKKELRIFFRDVEIWPNLWISGNRTDYSFLCRRPKYFKKGFSSTANAFVSLLPPV